MRTSRVMALAAAAAYALATPRFLGARANIEVEERATQPDLLDGFLRALGGGTRSLCGRGIRRRNSTTDWSKRRTESRKTLREQRHKDECRNMDCVDYYARRMAWIEANPEVFARREYQRVHGRSPAAGQFARVT